MKHNETEVGGQQRLARGSAHLVFFAWHHLANRPNWQKIVA